MHNQDQNSQSQAYEGYAIVELMGRNVIAGHVSEQTMYGAAFLRVDVPATNDQPAYTKFFGGSSIYAVTPTTAEIATKAAGKLAVRPVSEWVVPSAPTTRRIVDSFADDMDDDLEDE